MANRRFEMQDFRKILVRMRLGDSDRQIRNNGLCGRKKSAKLREQACKHGWLDPRKELPENSKIAEYLQSTGKPTSSSVSKYEDIIKVWINQGIQGTVIHDTLATRHGYSGSYSSVRRFIRRIEGQNPKATIMLDFNPGEAGQVDFGKGPTIIDVITGEVISTWFFVMTLAWSRHQYVEFVPDQSVETWLGCHRRAFEFFGGVPEKIIIDNPKCAITKACYYDPQVQRSYEEFAEGYGFRISPCPVRDPKKKGRVEAGVKYVKYNFLPLREFRSIADANKQVETWVLEKAGLRIHGTTKQKPLELFENTEIHFLKNLPDRPIELARWSKLKLHGNCHVQFEKSYYSAPYKNVGHHHWVRATENTIQIYLNHLLVAVHTRLRNPGQKSTVRDHLPPDAVAYLMRDPTWCRKKAQTVGPYCTVLIEQLFSNRVLDHLRGAQGILAFKKRYGSDRLEAACKRALQFDSAKYHTVKQILLKGLDRIVPINQNVENLNPIYKGAGKFCRDTKLFWTTNT